MRNYIVTWHIAGQSDLHRTGVLIVDGYSTLDDIPKIIAIAVLSGRDDADLVVVDAVQPEEAP